MTTITTAKTGVVASWDKIRLGLEAIGGILIFILYEMWRSKQTQNDELKAQISMIQTKEEADKLQEQINAKISDATAAGKQADDLKALSDQLAQKRQSLQGSDLTSDQVQQFYDKENQ